MCRRLEDRAGTDGGGPGVGDGFREEFQALVFAALAVAADQDGAACCTDALTWAFLVSVTLVPVATTVPPDAFLPLASISPSRVTSPPETRDVTALLGALAVGGGDVALRDQLLRHVHGAGVTGGEDDLAAGGIEAGGLGDGFGVASQRIDVAAVGFEFDIGGADGAGWCRPRYRCRRP